MTPLTKGSNVEAFDIYIGVAFLPRKTYFCYSEGLSRSHDNL